MSKLADTWAQWKVWWLSVAAGVLLGVTYRLIVGFKFLDGRFFGGQYDTAATWIMTIAFLAVVPFSIGYLSVRRYLQSIQIEDIRWWNWLFMPWIAIAVTMLVSALIGWEGLICLIFAGPIMLVFSLLGGITARLIWRNLRQRSPGSFSAVALPLLLILVESQFPNPCEIRTVNTDLLIHAPASVVWQNIKSVSAIQPQELPGSWISRIGFPRPIAATLSHDGVGGVRQASFTGSLIFTETVNRWEPEQDLHFSIHANTDSIPATTLDEHVTIGGAFFDVLDGEYRLEQRPDGVLLHLSSHERLSTHLNPYAALWTDAVMRSIQNEILVVVRNRSESGFNR
jgi:hypothetical protein